MRMGETEIDPTDRAEARPSRRNTGQLRGAVATAFPLATEAGQEILRAGGNAVDAAVATAWALCVCEPSASGLGGQTVMLIHFADGRACVIDGHSCAPAAVSTEIISSDQQRRGRRSSTVPSTPGTLNYAHEKHGVLARDRVMAPAIRIAEEGFPITPLHQRQTRWVADDLRASASSGLFLRNGAPPPIGYVFRQPELADTLHRLSELGAEDFYHGDIAHLIAEDMRRHDGLITEEDLANCSPPQEREPLSAVYRGYRILTVPPPGGGLQLLLAFNVLEQLELEESTAEDWYEKIALTTSVVFRERERRPVAPDDISLWDRLLSEDCARQIAAEVSEQAPEQSCVQDLAEEPGDTTHLSVADRHGNVVMLTQSIQSVFGAKVAHPALGFLYNNYLVTCPRYQHPYMLRGYCRPRSNVAPVLVLRRDSDAERPFLALGAAGSRRIISAILQVVSGVVDHDLDLAAAVAAPRVHGLLSRKVWIERPAASESLLSRLRARALQPIVKPRHAYAMGAVQALQFMSDGEIIAAADPRRDGAAAVLQ